MRYYFPSSCGASVYSDVVVTAIVDAAGNKRVGIDKTKNKIIPWNIFLLRGLEYFILGMIAQFSTFSRSDKLQIKLKKEQGMIEKISEKLNIATIYVQFFTAIILSLIFGFFIFSLIPKKIVLLILGSHADPHLNGLLIGLFRMMLIYLSLIILRFLPFMQSLYQFNGACNQVANSSGKIADISKNSTHYPLNYLNFLIFALLLSTFVVSLVALSGSFAFLFNFLIVLACIMISYELLYGVMLSKGRWAKDFIYLTSWLVVIKPGITQEETVRVTLNEIGKEAEIVEEDKIAMSAVLAEMQTKLISQDRFEKSDVDWIIATILKVNRAESKLIRSISMKEYREILRATERRSKGEPLSSIFGFVDFYGLRFDINKKVLSPRPETEILVETTLKLAKNYKHPIICDLCTGSGAIAIAIKKNIDAKVFAIDISKPALLTAEANAKKHDVKIDFICSDLFKDLKRNKKFDIIVSNPPYIKSSDVDKLPIEVKKYDPRIALDGGEDGLDFYRQIISQSLSRLTKGGYLIFELGKGQSEKVRQLLKQAGFVDTHIVKDYNKIERIIYARLG